MNRPDAGGGWAAIRYTFDTANRVGWTRLWKAMRSPNACKTCALGMGGQAGGMRNELGHFPEFCKKSLQAMAADLQPAIPDTFFETHDLDALRRMSPRELETAGRLARPLLLASGERHYRPIDWDEVIAHVADRLRAAAPDESFFYFSGRSSNEAGFLLQLLARVHGTNHVNNCSYYCHQASGAGLSGSVGSGTATVDVDDVEHADLVVLIGGNPASNHPRLVSHLMRVRRRGGEVVVVNPVRERGLERFRIPSDPRSLLARSEIASLYVQPHVGADIALLTAVARVLVDRDGVDVDFLRTRTEGWDELRTYLADTDVASLAASAGVTLGEVEAIAHALARSRNTIFAWTMGITHHAHGVHNVQWIANLALMRGMVGRPHAGLLPIRGHSNVQGMGTVGVTPALKDAMLARMQTLGVMPPATKGLDTMGCMEVAHAGHMKVATCLGGNLFGSNPDAAYARDALGRVGTVVYLSTTLNTGHAHGTGEETLILPVLARDEEPYRTTQESMFSFVRLSDGGDARHDGPRGEVPVIADLAGRLVDDVGPIRWTEMRDAAAVRKVIAEVVPGLEALGSIDATRQEFHIPGRILHGGPFPTDSGRARLHPHPVPETGRPSADHLHLMTVRSEGQFNTVVYEEEDLYRGQERRDVILMSADDLARLGLEEDVEVTVTSETGAMSGIRARAFPVRAGNAVMYYPEANVLVSRRVDPTSRTPAFKSTWVTVARAGR